MDPQFDSREQRQVLVHSQRQDPNDLRTRRRKLANEKYHLELKPTAVFLENGIVICWPRVWRPF